MGYAPAERFALKEHLGEQGVPVPDMVEAGLLIAGDDIPVPYDRFRDRVMFPITDFRGRIIAFGGRALSPDAPAKYLNSPETPLFHKGSNLYNGAAARTAVHDGAPLIVVEGYVDVIAHGDGRLSRDRRAARHRAHRGAARPALEDGRRADPLLRRRQGRPARRLSRRRSRAAAAAPGKSLRFALLPEGQDPDDLVRSGGREAVADVLAGARPLGEMLWTRETEAASFDTPERRAALEAKLNEVVRGIGDESVRKYYQQDFTARLRELLDPECRPRPRRPAARRGRRTSGRAASATASAAGPAHGSGTGGPAAGCHRAGAAGATQCAAVRQPDRSRAPDARCRRARR